MGKTSMINIPRACTTTAMPSIKATSLVVLLYLLHNHVDAQAPVSPCPRLFVYEPTSPEPNRWYGIVTLLSETDLRGVWLRLMFDRPVIQLGNWFAEAKGRNGNTEYLISDRTFKLTGGTPKTVRFYVQYDTSQPPPRLTGFKLNARTHCPEGGDMDTTTPALQTSNKEQTMSNAVPAGSGVQRYPVNLVSPCPRLFVYEPTSPEPNRWYGIVTLLSDTGLTGVWLRLNFDRPVLQLGNWFGKVKVRNENTEFVVNDRNFKLKSGVPQTVRIYAQYDASQPPPQLIEFRLNALIQCPEGAQIEATTGNLELQTSNVLDTTASPAASGGTQQNSDAGSTGNAIPGEVYLINSADQQYQVNAPGRMSPCPRLFVYEATSPEPDRWYGLVTLLSMTDLRGVWLRLMFDKPVLNVGSVFGEAKERDDKRNYLISNRNFKLQGGVPQTIRFYVQYDTNEPAPQLTGFKLNARSQCPEGADMDASTPTSELQTSNELQPGGKPVPAVSTTMNPRPAGGSNGNVGGHQYEVAAQGRVSPCPRLFVYEASSSEPDRWYGLVTLLAETDLKGVWLRLIFDKRVLNVGTDFGDTREREDKLSYLVSNRNFKLQAGVPQTIRFYVQYNTNEPAPRLTGFKLNARNQCPEGPDEDATTPTLELQTSNDLQPGAKPVPAVSTTMNPRPAGGSNGNGGVHQYEVAAQGRVSPCPRLFVYEASSPEPDRWYGLITLLTETDLRGVWLRLIFDKPVVNVGSFFGEVKERDQNKEYLISDRNFQLKGGTPQAVRFYVQYDTSQAAPQLVGFKLNARTICPEGPGMDATTPMLELQTSDQLKPTGNPMSGGNGVENKPPAGGKPGTSVQQVNAVSPCPRLFEYEPTSPEPDRWYGRVTLLNDADLSGIWLRLMFDKPVLSLGTFFGEATDKFGKINYLISDRTFKLKAGTPKTIRFYVQYDINEPPPRLIGFKYNARTQCPEVGNTIITTIAPDSQSSNDFGSTASPASSSGTLENPIPTGGTQRYPVTAESPCPRLFVYETTSPEPDRWYGIVTLLSETDLNGIWLRINFDRPVLQLGSWFGNVKVRNENMEFVINDRGKTLKAGTPQTVRFFVKYDTNKPAPRLTGFKLNARTQCPEGAGSDATMDTLELQTSNNLETTTNPVPIRVDSADNPGGGQNGGNNDFFPGDFFNQTQQTNSDNAEISENICGTVVQPKQTTNKQSINEGEYPWHAAVYHTKGINLVYWCGAVLISRSHVVTVAHCVTKWRTSTPRDSDNFVIYLGKFYLNRFTRGAQERLVDQIIPHPQYSPQKLCNDIAVIKFTSPAEITNYVRPICLWQDSTDLNLIANEEGTVAGWGVDEYGKLSEQLTHTQVAVGSLETCLYTLPTFAPLFFDKTTYCSGFKSSAPVCNGDSGNAMIFPRRSQNKIRWYLRGLLSLSVDSSNRFRCDVSHYIVFTDAAKYLDWIKQLMR